MKKFRLDMWEGEKKRAACSYKTHLPLARRRKALWWQKCASARSPSKLWALCAQTRRWDCAWLYDQLQTGFYSNLLNIYHGKVWQKWPQRPWRNQAESFQESQCPRALVLQWVFKRQKFSATPLPSVQGSPICFSELWVILMYVGLTFRASLELKTS